MTTFRNSRPSQGVRRRHRLLRAACAGTVVLLSWGAVGTTAAAAPATTAQAPVVAAAFIGLRVGSQGNDVRALQQALLDAGITVKGGADGVFGPATRQAVIDFQTARGLTASGTVDQATSAALASSGSETTGNSSALAVGARGAEVTKLQQQLIASGVYVAGGADGVFGQATRRAVTQYQQWNGLQVTGSVNTATAEKLGLTASTATPVSSIVAPDTGSGYVGLAIGARGSLVKELQTALQRSGVVVPGGADGVFGPATQTALKAFQRVNGLTQSGVVTAKGAGILGLGSASTSTTTTSNTSHYLGLRVGARGSTVKKVQSALIAAGVNVRGGADGVFGNATRSALTSYQKALGITADGTVNQATVDKLGLATGNTPAPMPSGSGSTATTSSSNPYVGLSVGSSGALVRELQSALMNTGLVVRGGADGSFGAATKSALIAFQSVNGISQTGVVTEKGAKLLGLGTGSVSIVNPTTSATVKLDRFPVQGLCFFGDTWGAARGGGRTHVGVDIIAEEGKLLYAVVDGEVSKLYWDQPGALSGNGLRIAQPNGTYFTYLHLLSLAPGIELGTEVKAGDVIGFVGNTGSSATAHLHFEIHPNGGTAINPYPYVKAIDGCKNTTPQYQTSYA